MTHDWMVVLPHFCHWFFLNIEVPGSDTPRRSQDRGWRMAIFLAPTKVTIVGEGRKRMTYRHLQLWPFTSY